MLPSSGAAQLSACGPSRLRPASSKTTAQVRQSRPSPLHSGPSCGKNRPAARASVCNSAPGRGRTTQARGALMDASASFIPQDRRRALARGESLPDRTTGAGLLADLSGFTALTEALTAAYGPRRGGEELTHILNHVFDE